MASIWELEQERKRLEILRDIAILNLEIHRLETKRALIAGLTDDNENDD